MALEGIGFMFIFVGFDATARDEETDGDAGRLEGVIESELLNGFMLSN